MQLAISLQIAPATQGHRICHIQTPPEVLYGQASETGHSVQDKQAG